MSDENAPAATPLTLSDGTVLRPIPHSELTGIPLLREVVDRITADQSAWNQSTWIGKADDGTLEPAVVEYIATHKAPPWDCGTAYCLAGHAVLAKGATLDTYHLRLVQGAHPYYDVDVDVDTHNHDYSRPGDIFSVSTVRNPEGHLRDVEAWARELLGLNDHQSDVLFSSARTLEEIEAMVTALEENPDADLYDYIGDGNYDD